MLTLPSPIISSHYTWIYAFPTVLQTSDLQLASPKSAFLSQFFSAAVLQLATRRSRLMQVLKLYVAAHLRNPMSMQREAMESHLHGANNLASQFTTKNFFVCYDFYFHRSVRLQKRTIESTNLKYLSLYQTSDTAP